MIEIAIKKDQTPSGVKPDTDEKKVPGKENMQQKAINAAIINASKQIMIKGIKQYGELTGNYTLSETVGQITNFASDVATIAVSGPIIGGIIVGTKYAIEIGQSLIKQENAKRDYELTLQRTGNITWRGSR